VVEFVKAQATVEALLVVGILIAFFTLYYLYYSNEQSFFFKTSEFQQAKNLADNAAVLVDAAGRVKGFYAEFPIPFLQRQNVTINFTKGFAVATLADGRQAFAPVQTNVSCSQCPLSPGVAWVSNPSGTMVLVGRK
jgi:hypothetical protein